MNFDKLCTLFTIQEPFYGIFLSSMNKVEDSSIPTIGVCRSGSVFCVHYNKNYMESLSVEAGLQILLHECLHIALQHFSFVDDLVVDGTPGSMNLFNIAADLEANCYVNKSVLEKHGAVFCDKFGFDKELGIIKYYELLKKKMYSKDSTLDGQMNMPSMFKAELPDGQGNSNSDTGQDNPSQSQSGNSDASSDKKLEGAEGMYRDQLDDHSGWKSMSKEEVNGATEYVDSMLVQAAPYMDKLAGKIPGSLRCKIDKLIKKPKPVADWRRYLRRFIGNEFSEDIRKSRRRQSKRFPDSPGNVHRRKSHILVAIDTSGSISMPEYMEFMGQIRSLNTRATFDILEVDTRIQYQYAFKGKIPTELHGGGGTSFQPAVDMYLDNRKKYDMLVYFTDGYATIPRNTPKNTLWVISSEGDHDRSKYKVNGASVVIIPKKQK